MWGIGGQQQNGILNQGLNQQQQQIGLNQQQIDLNQFGLNKFGLNQVNLQQQQVLNGGLVGNYNSINGGVTPQLLNNNLANHLGKIQDVVYSSWKK